MKLITSVSVTEQIPLTNASDAEFDVFFDLRLKKRLSEQSRGRWFQTQLRWLCHHCNEKEQEGNVPMEFCAYYTDVIMGAIASQITSLTIVYSTVYTDADQRKHRSSASLAFVRGIHRGPVNSPHKWPVTRKMFPFHDVIVICGDVTFLTKILGNVGVISAICFIWLFIKKHRYRHIWIYDKAVFLNEDLRRVYYLYPRDVAGYHSHFPV